MSNIVQFHDHKIELLQHNGQDYMTCRQIADVLDMSCRNGATDLYNAHKEEFDEEMSCLIKQGRTRVRIFNREGAWLIGMFARTPKAAEFRRWVLKVLKTVADVPAASGLPSLPATADPDLEKWCMQLWALTLENRVKKAVEAERQRIFELIKDIV